MLLPTVCLYLTLAACGVLIGLMVVKYDLYQRERWYMILLAVALGALGMFLAGQAQHVYIRSAEARLHIISNTELAILAGTTEELAKFLVVCGLGLFARRHLDEPVDGIIYGAFAGLGAALEESTYFLGWTAVPMFLPPQEPIRLAGHLIMGGIGGYGVGLLRTRIGGMGYAAGSTLLAFVAAIVLHTLWDVVAFDAAEHFERARALKLWHSVSPVALMLAGMIVFKLLIHRGLRHTREHMQVCDLRTRECPAGSGE